MEYIEENPLHLEGEKVDIRLMNNTKFIRYYIECFDRDLMILFNDEDLSIEDYKIIKHQLDEAYGEWIEDAKCECCEEHLINSLDIYYQNSIVAVLYIGEEEE